jgi:hypothetical protein
MSSFLIILVTLAAVFAVAFWSGSLTAKYAAERGALQARLVPRRSVAVSALSYSVDGLGIHAKKMRSASVGDRFHYAGERTFSVFSATKTGIGKATADDGRRLNSAAANIVAVTIAGARGDKPWQSAALEPFILNLIFLVGCGSVPTSDRRHAEKPLGSVRRSGSSSCQPCHGAGRWPLRKLSPQALVRQSAEQQGTVLLGCRWIRGVRPGLGFEGWTLSCSSRRPVDRSA